MRQKQSIFSLFLLSPSSRRAWIEMRTAARSSPSGLVALLAEGVDRNMSLNIATGALPVALLAEGVDRNKPETAEVSNDASRPPRGGRG